MPFTSALVCGPVLQVHISENVTNFAEPVVLLHLPPGAFVSFMDAGAVLPLTRFTFRLKEAFSAY